MPIDEYSAWQGGILYEKPRFNLIAKLLAKIGIHNSLKKRVQRAFNSFEKNATIKGKLFVGLNSFCLNGQHDKLKISIDDSFYCRGILRLEDFGAGEIRIHSNVYVGDDSIVSCANRIEIGSNTLIANHVHIFDNNSHPIEFQNRLEDWDIISGKLKAKRSNIDSMPIKIGKNVWIGLNSCIMKGVTIGDNSVIGAGSIVINDIPANVVAAGNPAVIIKEINSNK